MNNDANVVDLLFEKSKRSEDSLDISPLNLIRELLEDIERGDIDPQKLFIIAVDYKEGERDYHFATYNAQMDNTDVVYFLERAKLRSMGAI